jgi:peroxiredoxin Q/BCP
MSSISQLPEFELPDENGETFQSSCLLGQASVIYFYPKDETRGCTAQACSFRDAFEDFKEAGARVIGISSDSVEKHLKFKENNRLPFTLLADSDKKVRQLFGVKGNLFGLIPGRETFVFDKTGKLVHHFKSQMQWNKHIDEALKIVKEL